MSGKQLPLLCTIFITMIEIYNDYQQILVLNFFYMYMVSKESSKFKWISKMSFTKIDDKIMYNNGNIQFICQKLAKQHDISHSILYIYKHSFMLVNFHCNPCS